jgi:hypothetical protein
MEMVQMGDRFMKKLQFLVLSVLFTVSVLVSKLAYCLEETSDSLPTKKSSTIQLQKVTDDTLGAILGTGNNALLKIDMDLKSLKEPVEHDFLEVPVRLYLTDFASNPTSHKPIQLSIKVDCEQTPLVYVLPEKPSSFESYNHFSDWLNRAYFTYENRIAYDFHVDVNQVAPSLVEQLYVVASDGYRFAGTYAIHNTRIMPDDCSPKVSYVSQRGNAKTTTATLGGNIYLNKKPYPINDHHQAFPHPRIEQKVFKKDETKKFYHHDWLAQSQITVKETYQDFPNTLIKEWPNPPSETYSLLRQKPADLKRVSHISCMDGITGASVDIPDGKIFLIDIEDISENASGFMESIVTDEEGKLFIMRYLHPDTEEETSFLTHLEEEAERIIIEKAKTECAFEKSLENLKKQLEVSQKESSEKKMKMQDFENVLAVAQKNIEDLKIRLEMIQKESDEERLRKTGIIKTEEAEQLKIIKVQEVEQRKKQEKIDFYLSKIDEDIKYVNLLIKHKNEYVELLKVMEELEGYSTSSAMVKTITQNQQLTQKIVSDGARAAIKSLKEYNAGRRGTFHQDLYSTQREVEQNRSCICKRIIKDISSSMEIYKEYTGMTHSRWDEVKNWS